MSILSSTVSATVSPYMTYIKLGLLAAVIAAFGWLYMDKLALEKSLSDKDTVIAELNSTVKTLKGVNAENQITITQLKKDAEDSNKLVAQLQDTHSKDAQTINTLLVKLNTIVPDKNNTCISNVLVSSITDINNLRESRTFNIVDQVVPEPPPDTNPVLKTLKSLLAPLTGGDDTK